MACMHTYGFMLVPPVAGVKHEHVGSGPPVGMPWEHVQADGSLHTAACRVWRREAMDHHDHGRAVVLDGEVVVGENHGEVALVPADRLPGPLVHSGRRRAGRGRHGGGEHAHHGLPLVPTDRVPGEDDPTVPAPLQHVRRVEPNKQLKPLTSGHDSDIQEEDEDVVTWRGLPT